MPALTVTASPRPARDLPTAAERRALVPLWHRSNRVMWINDDRVFYAGLAGAMSTRRMGGWHLYVALGDPIRVSIDGQPWQGADLALVPPYTPHQVACEERLLADLVIEAESVDPAALPPLLGSPAGAVQGADEFVRRVRHFHAWLCTRGRQAPLATADVDTCLFGHPLQRRALDPRIESALRTLRQDPATELSARELAQRCGLSFSRFLHLFKQQTGASWRDLRTWKRARSLLHHVTRDTNLVHVALETGYPDSAHFSHSIRQVYGLRPRDIFAGSRRLTVVG